MMKQGCATWHEKESAVYAYLEERLADGAIELTSDGWLGVGMK